mgnify:CR=1 FL=1
MAGLFLPTAAINYGQPVNWASPLTRGLVSWWLTLPNTKGGVKWYDLCGRAHGTLTNMDPASDWVPTTRPGGFGALDFVTNDYVDFSAGAPPSFPSGSPFTISAWALFRAATGRILGVPDVSANNFSKITDTAITVRCGATLTTFTVPSIGTTNWHHVCASRTAADSVRVWLDGAESSTGALTNAGTFAPTFIGRTSTAYHNGQLDDITIRSIAFDDSEVWQQYQDSQLGHPQMLQRLRRPIPFAPAAAGTDTGVLIGGRLTRSMLINGRLVA